LSRIEWAAELDDRLDALVHPGVPSLDGERRRHRLFIASRLGVGAAALAFLPFLLAFQESGFRAGLLVFASVGLLLVAAAIVSWSGRIAPGSFVTSLAIVLVAGVLWRWGGPASSAALGCLLLAPIEAISSRRSHAILLATMLAGVAASLLILGAPAVAAEAGDATTLAAFLSVDIVAGSLGWLALRASSEADDRSRGGDAAVRAAVDRIGDMVALHDSSGDVVQAHGCLGLVGVPSSELHGSRFLARLHLADRPTYLRAISKAGVADVVTTILLRIRSGLPDRGTYILCEMRLRMSAGEPSLGCVAVSVTRRVGEADAGLAQPAPRPRDPGSCVLAGSPAERDSDIGLDGLVQAAAPLNDLLRERARDIA